MRTEYLDMWLGEIRREEQRLIGALEATDSRTGKWLKLRDERKHVQTLRKLAEAIWTDLRDQKRGRGR